MSVHISALEHSGRNDIRGNQKAEDRIAALVTSEKPQKAPGEVRGGGAPLTKSSRGFLGQ